MPLKTASGTALILGFGPLSRGRRSAAKAAQAQEMKVE
jgi:hypothetical protein